MGMDYFVSMIQSWFKVSCILEKKLAQNKNYGKNRFMNLFAQIDCIDAILNGENGPNEIRIIQKLLLSSTWI